MIDVKPTIFAGRIPKPSDTFAVEEVAQNGIDESVSDTMGEIVTSIFDAVDPKLMAVGAVDVPNFGK